MKATFSSWVPRVRIASLAEKRKVTEFLDKELGHPPVPQDTGWYIEDTKGRVVAACGLAYSIRGPNVVNLAVDRDTRRLGFGGLLLAAARAHVATETVFDRLYCEAPGRLRSFLEHNGFSQEDR